MLRMLNKITTRLFTKFAVDDLVVFNHQTVDDHSVGDVVGVSLRSLPHWSLFLNVRLLEGRQPVLPLVQTVPRSAVNRVSKKSRRIIDKLSRGNPQKENGEKVKIQLADLVARSGPDAVNVICYMYGDTRIHMLLGKCRREENNIVFIPKDGRIRIIIDPEDVFHISRSGKMTHLAM